MADSMCGPSNALQNFQKQSQGDRTLQQDRLSSRTPQSQGFRNAGPSAHNLDPEFEAFQAGQLPLQHPEAGFHPAFQRAHTPQPQQHMNAGPGASWANDFQRLAIAPAPGMQQQGLPQAQHAGGWHQEFAQMNNSQMKMPQQGQQQHSYNAPLERLSSLATTPFGMGQQPMYQTPMYQPPQMQHEQPQQQMGGEIGAFDEAAFAAAFDQAAKSELQSEQASLSQEFQDSTNLAPIGADAIHHPDAPLQQLLTPAQESDDLARTAGALLTSVQGDQSDKFANSVFLQLMRQLRDKEVVVEGDAILPAGSAGAGAEGAQNSIRKGNEGDMSHPGPGLLTPMDPPAERAQRRETVEAVPLVPRMMGGMRGRGLRTPQEKEQALQQELGRMTPEEQGAVKLAGEQGLKGLTDRMKELQVEGDRKMRQMVEEAVAEELAREGKSWGPS